MSSRQGRVEEPGPSQKPVTDMAERLFSEDVAPYGCDSGAGRAQALEWWVHEAPRCRRVIAEGRNKGHGHGSRRCGGDRSMRCNGGVFRGDLSNVTIGGGSGWCGKYARQDSGVGLAVTAL